MITCIEKHESYRITIEKRNSQIKSKDIISQVAGLISNKVSLENPDWEIIIQVLGNLTGISILPKNSILSVSNGSVQIEISNYGINNVNSFNVIYSANGGNLISENISSNLLSGNNMNYIFATPISGVSGQVDICSWTEYPIDMQNNNDTSCITTDAFQ